MMYEMWIKDLRQTGSNYLGNEISVLRSREIRGRALVALAMGRLDAVGKHVFDEDGCRGMIGIYYEDGDFVTLPGANCAAHLNPRIVPLQQLGRTELFIEVER